jgi:hypothetical protein
VFTSQPTDGPANVTLSPNPVVAVEDGSGDVVTTDETTMVTLTWSGAGTLRCDQINNQATVIHGVATFTGCTVDTAGSGTLDATSTPVYTEAVGASITIS